MGDSMNEQLNRPDESAEEEINLLEIVRQTEGSIALLRCTSVKYYEPCDHCKDETTCTIRNTFKDIRDYTYQKLEQTSLANLAMDAEAAIF